MYHRSGRKNSPDWTGEASDTVDMDVMVRSGSVELDEIETVVSRSEFDKVAVAVYRVYGGGYCCGNWTRRGGS